MKLRLFVRLFALVAGAWLGVPEAAGVSRQFGDIGVSVHALANGKTFHGYFEHRFTIINANPGREHFVSVELPSESRGRNRESIGGLSRTVRVSPGGTVSLPLHQPALPIDGQNAARIRVDGREEGVVPLPGRLDHADVPLGSTEPRPCLVSRSLDSSALDTALSKLAGGGGTSRVDYGPVQATGRPNVPAMRGGYQGNAWMPQRMGAHDWLELTYSKALVPEKIRIFKNGRGDNFQQAEFFDKAGASVGIVKNSVARSRHESRFKPYDLNVTGVTQAVHRVRLEFDGSRGGYVGVDAVELIGGGISTFATGAAASSTYATVHRGSSAKAVDKTEILRSELEVGEWSDNWLAYTPFDLVVLHESDFRSMPASVAQAFWRHVEAGGAIAVLGRAIFPKGVTARRQPGDGAVARYLVGFGECLEIDARDTRELGGEELKEIESAAKRTAGVWSTFGDAAHANSAFPVIENLGIPVRGIAFIMLVFILVVGPLNIFVLAKLNRRIWMLWTIPLISLGACAVVFLFSLFKEGITPTVRAESVTLLDHSTRRATTLGRLAFYCPLTPSGGLLFDHDTEVFPLVSRGWQGGTSKTLDWTDGQRMRSGWLQARMPAHFAVRRSETRRERVEFQKDVNGNLMAMNGLGATITKLTLRPSPAVSGSDVTGVWVAEKIAPGARVAMVWSNNQQGDTKRHELLRRLYREGRWSLDTANSAVSVTTIPDGCYVAEMEEAPFLEDGLAGRKRLNLGSIVVGILSPEEVAL